MNLKQLKTVLQIVVDEWNCDSYSILINLSENDVKLVSDTLKNNVPARQLQVVIDGLDLLLKQRICKIKEIRNNDSQIILYKTLKLFYLNTSQEERFIYTDYLIDTIYNLTIQKLTELKHLADIISKHDYIILFKSFLPHVKVDVLIEEIHSKEIIRELIEYFNCPYLLREDTYLIVKNVFPDEQIKYLGYYASPKVNSVGFNGDYAELKIFIERQEEEQTHSFFVKFLPKSEQRADVVTYSFIKEKLYYKKFLSALKNIGIEDVDFVPKCYMTSDSFVVFDDLYVNNYSPMKQLAVMNYDHLSVAIKQLAKMHSCSILFEEKLGDLFETEVRIDKYLPKMVEETFFKRDSCNLANFEQCVRCLRKFPQIITKLNMNEFQNTARVLFDNVYNMVKKSDKYRNVVTHGNICWSNIFFKRNKNNKPVDCVFLDFQMVRYAPPACDILMLLHVVTDRKTRKNKMNTLVKEYHDELHSLLLKYDLNIENILPFNELVKSIDELQILGIYVSMLYQYLSVIPMETSEVISSCSGLGPKFWTDVDYRCSIYDQIWDQIKNDSKLKENTLDLYEICVRNRIK